MWRVPGGPWLAAESCGSCEVHRGSPRPRTLAYGGVGAGPHPRDPRSDRRQEPEPSPGQRPDGQEKPKRREEARRKRTGGRAWGGSEGGEARRHRRIRGRGRRRIETWRRRRCSPVPPLASPCKAGDVSRRYFLPSRRFANVGVAGSSPVSCSSIREPLREVARRGSSSSCPPATEESRLPC